MPSPKYTSREAAFSFSRLHALHLSLGDCLLAGYGKSERSCLCGLRDEDGEFLAEVAQHLWSKHKRAVLKEHGKLPFPTFAEVVLGGAELPKPSATWTDTERGAYAIVAEEVDLARGAP